MEPQSPLSRRWGRQPWERSLHDRSGGGTGVGGGSGDGGGRGVGGSRSGPSSRASSRASRERNQALMLMWRSVRRWVRGVVEVGREPDQQ